MSHKKLRPCIVKVSVLDYFPLYFVHIKINNLFVNEYYTDKIYHTRKLY